DSGGLNAAAYAAANGNLAFIDALVSAGLTKGHDQALTFAVRSCRTDIMKRLLTAGAKTNAQLDSTPMIVVAAGSNCGEGIGMLLDAGADITAGDESGTTALMTAASQGFAPIVELLLARGADMERTNKDQQTAWLMAAMSDQREVVELLRAQREKNK